MSTTTSTRAKPPSSFSISTAIQYTIFAVIAYVLAGTPSLHTILSSTSSSSSSSSSSQAERSKWKNGFRNGRGRIDMSKEKIDSLVIPNHNLTCPDHGFKGVYVLNREPLVVYIEGFLSEKEADEVVDVSTPHFTPSTVWTAGTERLDPTVRLSSKARVPRSSSTVQCIEERARAFQGWNPYIFVEKMWAQKYGPGGHYAYHYDGNTGVRGMGRISSFMVWVGDECEGGGTRFPRLEKKEGRFWCRFVDCEDGGSNGGEESVEEEDGEGMGVTFKPIKGNAVYWENMKEDGTAYEESWHAGLPVVSGEKIGLNIWSWYQEGWDPYAEALEE